MPVRYLGRRSNANSNGSSSRRSQAKKSARRAGRSVSGNPSALAASSHAGPRPRPGRRHASLLQQRRLPTTCQEQGQAAAPGDIELPAVEPDERVAEIENHSFDHSNTVAGGRRAIAVRLCVQPAATRAA